MSFDVYFQRFVDGDADESGRDEVVAVLAPYLKPSVETPGRIEHPAGNADVYGLGDGDGDGDGDGMMINHIEDGLWDLLVEAARAGRWAIMPIGCPTCVFNAAMLANLPEDLRQDAVVVNSGADVRDLIANS